MLQLIDVILAWLVAEDDGAKKKIQSLLADRDGDLSLVRKTLQGKYSLLLMALLIMLQSFHMLTFFRANGGLDGGGAWAKRLEGYA